MNELASDLAIDVLEGPEFLEPVVLLRPQAGGRIADGGPRDGLWSGNDWQAVAVQVPTVPGGRQRLNEETGTRDEADRSFWMPGSLPSFRSGVDKGDLLALGRLGPSPNTFQGDTFAQAEAAMTDHANDIDNAGWLSMYQTHPDLLVLIKDATRAQLQAWDPFTRTWIPRDTFRVVNAQPYGAFTVAETTRLVPGAQP